MFWGIVVLLILVCNFFAIIGMVFWEQKSPHSTVLWILAMALLPIIAFIAYLFFGRGPRMGRHKKYLEKAHDFLEYEEEFKSQLSIVNDKPIANKNILALTHFNLKSGKSLCSYQNDAKIFTDITLLYDTIISDIQNAKENINLEYFIIKPDESGKRLRDALTEKAKQGVKVKLVYDDIGTLKLKKRFFKSLIKAGGEVQRFFASKIRLLNLNMNYRNHRKIIVIDNKIAYTGGANIGDEYVNKHKRIKPWRDTHVRIEGEIAALINLRFLSDFAFAAKKDIDDKELEAMAKTVYKSESKLLTQFVVSGPDAADANIKAAYIKAIYDAKTRVCLQTPYFIPDESFIDALKNAALSGVDVSLMIPKVPDKKFIYYATMSYAKQLLKYGIKVYMYNGFIHSKTLLIDDEISSIGTFNIDMRSFVLHFEDTVFFYDESFAKQMLDIFNKDIESSTVLTEEYVKNRKAMEKFLEKLSRLFTPLF